MAVCPIFSGCFAPLWTRCLLLSFVLACTAPAAETRADENHQRIETLCAEIARHDDLYFKKAAPVISDAAYDELKREIARLRLEVGSTPPEHAQLASSDDRVGSFSTFRHRQRMLSLEKSYTEIELRAFDTQLKQRLDVSELSYVVEPKFDGVAISVTFEQGRLVRAVTRGDGVTGDDVTANVRSIVTLPHALRSTSADGTANFIPEIVELRGEVYFTFSEFKRINREREENGDSLFANPRNLAAGTLKQLDAAEVAQRRLKIVFYGLGAIVPASLAPESQSSLHALIKNWGLPGVEKFVEVHSAEELWRAVQAIGQSRKQLDFPIDGAVVKLSARSLQQKSGETDYAPNWAMAYKFMSERAETRIKAITLQVGRTGVLAPVAELEPVELAGTTVRRVTLHNRDEIVRKDIRVGDFVYLEKAGEIIPAIVEVNLARRASPVIPYEFPATCPGCGSVLKNTPGVAVVRCGNYECPEQIRRRLEYFASNGCVDIAGLGASTVEKLVSRIGVKDVGDIYFLRRTQLLLLGSNVEKSADRLLAAIERSKQVERWRVIKGLGIPRVGSVSAKGLARHFDSLTALAEADVPSLMAAGLTRAVAEAAVSFLQDVRQRKILEKLTVAGVAQGERGSSAR